MNRFLRLNFGEKFKLAGLIILLFITGGKAQEISDELKNAAALLSEPEEKENLENTVGQKNNEINYEPLRYDEDWSFLADESKRTEYLDSLKYIGLGRENWYVSIGGEARARFEYYKNENFNDNLQDGNGYFLQRYLLHADWHFGEKFRVFTQLQSGLITNRRGGARAIDRNRLDFNQFFADLKIYDKNKKSLTVRAGRQEIYFGTGKLVNTREGLNLRQSFDGIRVSAKTNKWTLNAFAVKPVRINFDFFNDKPQNDQSFGGVYVSRPLGIMTKGGGVDVYYFFLDRKQARFDQGTKREIRHTVGTRIFNSKEAFDYNYEFIYQFGKFGRGKINAWSVATENGYTFDKAVFKPRFSFKANVTSGDKNKNDDSLETFNALFPSGAYFGYLSPVGPYNHINLHATANFKLTSRLSLYADHLWFWRTSLNDGVYGIPGVLLRPSAAENRERFVGRQFDATANFKIDRHTTMTAAFGRFLIGDFLRGFPNAKNTNYFSGWITYRF